MLTELDDVLDSRQQGPSQPARPVIETTDTNRDEGVISHWKNKVLSKKTDKMKKAWASDELARLFVNDPIDPMAKPSHFHCQLCQRNVSVLTQGSFEILRHYQGAKYFAIDQRLRLETSGRRVIDFSWNLLPGEKIERQRARIMQKRLVRRDREYPFCQDLITDDASVVDPQLPILTKVSSSLEFLRLGGSYELEEQLCAQFSLTGGCVGIEVCWSHYEVLVSIRIFLYHIRICSGTLHLRSESYVFVTHFQNWCLVCRQFCWMENIHECCRGLWTGWSRVAMLVWSSTRGQKPLLFSFGLGTGTRCLECVWL